MKFLLFSLALCAGWGSVAAAENLSGQRDGRGMPGWEAVGRLNVDGQNMCTGALIAPDIVLTAAHCLYNSRTGKLLDATKIEFHAGLVGDRAKATRKVARAVIHDGYRYSPAGQAQVGADLAVLRLDRAISGDVITPLQTDDRPNRGDAVSVLSYRMDRSTQPSLEDPCYVLARQHETLVMSCSVEFGASGAPVFLANGGSRPRLVSVVTAKATMGGKSVSIATVLDAALKQLLRRAG